jgi:DNA-binding NtrC family response regulator
MGGTLPVLVVEDEALLLSMLVEAVERGGVEAIGASSGNEALGLLEREEFSAVVTDLRMPGMIGGAEIFDWVGKHRPELAQRFLFVTGNAQDPHAVETRQRTGAMFLEKPFRITQLTELIRKMVRPAEAWHV